MLSCKALSEHETTDLSEIVRLALRNSSAIARPTKTISSSTVARNVPQVTCAMSSTC